MINLDGRQNNYDELGFWKHFAFVRFLYNQLNEYKEDNYNLRGRLERTLNKDSDLTEKIKSSNNIEAEVITTDDSDDNFYKRMVGETVEDFLERIGTSRPKTKTARSANDIIEDAKKEHVRQHNEQMEKADEAIQNSKTTIVGDLAIDKIGNQIEGLKK